MKDNMEAWILFICAFLCAAIFLGVGLFAFTRKDPMHFWSGSTVPAGKIRDVPAYNWANGWLWIGYAIGMVLVGAIAFWSMKAAGALIAIYTVVSIPVLVILYKKIYQKYQK